MKTLLISLKLITIKKEGNNNVGYDSMKPALNKKCEVLEKVTASNKKRFEAEITKNIKTIFTLEDNINELYNLHNEKVKTAYAGGMKVSDAITISVQNKTGSFKQTEPQLINDYTNYHQEPVKRENKTEGRLFSQDKIESKAKRIYRKPEQRKTAGKDPSINPDNDDTYFTPVKSDVVTKKKYKDER